MRRYKITCKTDGKPYDAVLDVYMGGVPSLERVERDILDPDNWDGPAMVPSEVTDLKVELVPSDNQSRHEVAALLERLADGETVSLGEFSSRPNLEDNPAGSQAECLREVADSLRGDR